MIKVYISLIYLNGTDELWLLENDLKKMLKTYKSIGKTFFTFIKENMFSELENEFEYCDLIENMFSNTNVISLSNLLFKYYKID